MNNYSIFKVIKIIDEYSIVINGGLEKNISKGDDIEIFLEGEELFDPDTGESLGTLDFVKDSLEVTEVYLKFSVCERIITKRTHKPSPLSQAMISFAQSASNFSGTTEIETTRKKINIDPKQATGRLEGDSKIKIGDTVRIALAE